MTALPDLTSLLAPTLLPGAPPGVAGVVAPSFAALVETGEAATPAMVVRPKPAAVGNSVPVAPPVMAAPAPEPAPEIAPGDEPTSVAPPGADEEDTADPIAQLLPWLVAAPPGPPPAPRFRPPAPASRGAAEALSAAAPATVAPAPAPAESLPETQAVSPRQSAVGDAPTPPTEPRRGITPPRPIAASPPRPATEMAESATATPPRTPTEPSYQSAVLESPAQSRLPATPHTPAPALSHPIAMPGPPRAPADEAAPISTEPALVVSTHLRPVTAPSLPPPTNVTAVGNADTPIVPIVVAPVAAAASVAAAAVVTAPVASVAPTMVPVPALAAAPAPKPSPPVAAAAAIAAIASQPPPAFDSATRSAPHRNTVTAALPPIAGAATAQLPSASPPAADLAAVIRTASPYERRSESILREPAPPPPIAPTSITAPTQFAAATIQTGIDLRQEPGLHRMIDHIEQLRDAADARSTRISLSPDALGKVDVTVTRDGDGVQVHLAAAESGTRQLLTEARPQLTELAESRGVRIERTVIADTHTGAGDGAGQRGHQPQPRAPTPPRTPFRAAPAADAPVSDTRIA